jgi:hypothetical protein
MSAQTLFCAPAEYEVGVVQWDPQGSSSSRAIHRPWSTAGFDPLPRAIVGYAVVHRGPARRLHFS